MRYARILAELLHLTAGIVAIAAMFGAAAWAYPQGHSTIWAVGYVTMAVIVGLSIPRFRSAWSVDHAAQ